MYNTAAIATCNLRRLINAMVEIDRTRRNPRRSTRTAQKSEDEAGKRLMEFATNENDEDQIENAITSSKRSSMKQSTKSKKAQGKDQEDEDLNDYGLLDSTDDDDEEEEEDSSSRPWLRKKAKDNSSTTSRIKSKSKTEIPLKKKRKANEKDDDAIPAAKSNKNTLKKQKANLEESSAPSLIANMVPVTQKKDYAKVRDWKSNDEYFKSQQQQQQQQSHSVTTSSTGRNKSKNVSNTGNRPGNQNASLKDGMKINKLKSPARGRESIPIPNQQNKQKAMPNASSTSISKPNNNNNEKARKEIQSKITKDLGKLIEKVLEAKGKISSSSDIMSSQSIDNLLKQTLDPTSSTLLARDTPKGDNEIDWVRKM